MRFFPILENNFFKWVCAWFFHFFWFYGSFPWSHPYQDFLRGNWFASCCRVLSFLSWRPSLPLSSASCILRRPPAQLGTAPCRRLGRAVQKHEVLPHSWEQFLKWVCAWFFHFFGFYGSFPWSHPYQDFLRGNWFASCCRVLSFFLDVLHGRWRRQVAFSGVPQRSWVPPPAEGWDRLSRSMRFLSYSWERVVLKQQWLRGWWNYGHMLLIRARAIFSFSSQIRSNKPMNVPTHCPLRLGFGPWAPIPKMFVEF